MATPRTTRCPESCAGGTLFLLHRRGTPGDTDMNVLRQAVHIFNVFAFFRKEEPSPPEACATAPAASRALTAPAAPRALSSQVLMRSLEPKQGWSCVDTNSYLQ